MTEGPRKNEEELRALIEELAEVVAQSSDEEILAEAREDGVDPKQAAQQVRMFLQDKVKAYQQRALHAAQENYKSSVQSLYQNSFRLPPSKGERRNLLRHVFSIKPDIGSAVLTAQHREFKNLSDEDVEGYLKQLQELGVLDEEGLGEVEEGK